MKSRSEELIAASNAAKETEAKANHKLQNLQQVSRSQSALMRGELGKSRRRLAHMTAVADQHKKQARWLQEQSPALKLPSELRQLPTEEDVAEEAEELNKLHERWERDV